MKKKSAICTSFTIAVSHLSNEIVGEVGSEHLRYKLCSQLFSVRGHRSNHPCSDAETVVNSAGGIKKGLFIFLQVLVVRAREALGITNGDMTGRTRSAKESNKRTNKTL